MLTMKHKEKRLEYASQYQSMSAKEWRKVFFSDEKKFNLDGQEILARNNFSEENNSTRHCGEGSLMIWKDHKRSSSTKPCWVVVRTCFIFKKTSTTICQWSTKSSRLCEHAKWFISCTRRASSMWRRVDFRQDNAAIHNASITKKYLFEQKIRLLDYPACSPDLNPIEKL